jgi:hypothetical protein
LAEEGGSERPGRRSRSRLGPVGRKLAGGLRGRPVGPSDEPGTPMPAIQPGGRGCVPLSSLLFVGVVLLIILGSCDLSSAEGLPEEPGRYALKEKSVTYDGERYSFLWSDAGGALQRATTDDVKLQLAEENALEITAERDAILHLRQDEPVTVEARDQQGDFGSFWYPFIVGQMVGSGPAVGAPAPPPEYRQPTYRFPPTDRIDRGDTITGSSSSSTSRPPDYGGLAPVGGAVSGQAGGAGGGSAAINRSQSSSTVSGQAGGAGGGSAALNKSGSFRSGDQGYTSKVESGQLNPISGRTEPRVGAGSGARTSSGSSSVGGSKPSISTGRGSAPSPRVGSSSGSSGSSGRTPSISTTRRK